MFGWPPDGPPGAKRPFDAYAFLSVLLRLHDDNLDEASVRSTRLQMNFCCMSTCFVALCDGVTLVFQCFRLLFQWFRLLILWFRLLFHWFRMLFYCFRLLILMTPLAFPYVSIYVPLLFRLLFQRFRLPFLTCPPGAPRGGAAASSPLLTNSAVSARTWRLIQSFRGVHQKQSNELLITF